MWDQHAKSKPALRGSLGKPKDMMPSLPAAVHWVDSADTAPNVADGSFEKGANKKAHPIAALKNAGWVSSSEVIRKL
jgi:hypothetical protein